MPMDSPIQKFYNDLSSSLPKEPILHESLCDESHLPSDSSQSSSTVSMNGYINSNPTSRVPLTNSNSNSEHLIIKPKSRYNLINKRHGEIVNDCTLFNALNETEGLNSVKSHMDLAKTAHSVRSLAKRLNRATIHLNLNNVLIITKARDNSLIYLTRELTGFLLKKYSSLNIYVDKGLENSKRFDAANITRDCELPECKERLKFWNKKMIRNNEVLFDFVITLGGDGTVLLASTLFQNAVPPIIPFSLGSLGFLTSFNFENFTDILTDVIENGVKTDLRMRFTCRVFKSTDELVCEQQVLNELTVDRGPSPYVTMLELYGDDNLLTVAQADGVIIATPTGSTAYSLSAGGSLVHPEVSCICITPICPHTLSFRPMMVPDSIKLTIKVPSRSRSTAYAAFDGRTRVKLDVGDYVTVCASVFPFPTVKNSKHQYFESVSRVLNWNNRKEQKSFKHLLSDNNKKKYVAEEEEHESMDEEEEDWDIDYSDSEESSFS